MIHKKSIFLIGSIIVSQSVFAQQEKKENSTSKINLDVLASAGYTSLSGLDDDLASSDFPTATKNMNGFNVNASGLYSIHETSLGAPVVGLGLNYSRVVGSTSYLGVIDRKDTFSTLAIIANAGFKFKPAEKFAIFALGNFGFGVYNDYNVDLSASLPIIAGATIGASIDPTIKNHFIYGASLIGTYEVVQNFSVGAGVTYNRHNFKVELNSSSEDLSANEISANLVASYSL